MYVHVDKRHQLHMSKLHAQMQTQGTRGVCALQSSSLQRIWTTCNFVIMDMS